MKSAVLTAEKRLLRAQKSKVQMRKKINNDKEKVSARAKALDLLLYKTRTEKELYDKLTEREYTPEEAAEALEYVRSYGYVNDEDYAVRYVMSNGGKKGKAAVRRELREKGVEDEFIENALEDMPDEKEAVMELLSKKAGAPHRLDEKEYRRLFSFFARRGFAAGAVTAVLKDYQNEAVEDEGNDQFRC